MAPDNTGTVVERLPRSITLTATPRTSIWRKPNGDLHKFEAPHQLTPARPLSTLQRVRVAISGNWLARHDNAGLLIILHDSRRGPSPAGAEPNSTSSWICAGMGIRKNGASDAPFVTVVSAEGAASDWSAYPRDADDEGGEQTTVEVRVEKDQIGHSMWVYYLSVDKFGSVKERHPIRELSWMFGDGWESHMTVQVGVFASLPSYGEQVRGKELFVKFDNLQVDWTTEDD